MTTQADLRHVIYALSDALDLVGVDDVAHGKRVGVMASACARVAGWDEKEIGYLFDLGLLHDIGVSKTSEHNHLVTEFDWAGSQSHAQIGARYLQHFPHFESMAEPIFYHHTRWDELVAAGVDELTIRRANLILLVDRVDALTAPYYATNQALQHAGEIRQQIEQRSGTYFSPDLVELFLKASDNEAFWLVLEPRALQIRLEEMSRLGDPISASNFQLIQVAEIFARIVDAKSPFTVTHSRGVAKTARRIAEYMGIGLDHCEKLEVAGLLHDLGKLRIPDEILEKPAKLDASERISITSHSFETQQILKRIKGFEEITLWAASHHEAPGGQGYPYGLDGATLPLEARILRVADIFQAMVQDRPYRKGLSAQEIDQFMRGQLDANLVDKEATDVLLSHLDEMISVARLEAA